MEIERKFLLSRLPDITPVKVINIYQGYVSVDPEVRIRSYEVVEGDDKGHKDYKITVKGDGDLLREEIETYISEEFFNQTVAFIKHPLIHKRFFIYNVNGRRLECSIVDEELKTKFIYGEVEFQSESDAEDYEWPFSGAFDVTREKRYKMKNYWKRTRLEVNENVIKGFAFPSFDEWDRMKRSWRAKLGDYCCEIHAISYGSKETTYGLAIANNDVPHNIWIDRIVHKVITCHHSDVESLRCWYETSVKEAQEEWRAYIAKKYMG